MTRSGDGATGQVSAEVIVVTSSPNPMAARLGAQMRAMRKHAGLTLVKLGSLVDRDHSWASKIENGHRTLSPEDAEMVCDAIDVDDETRADLVGLARRAVDENWAAGQYKPVATLRYYETHAVSAVNCEPSLVPGLLQTRRYALAVMKGVPDGEAEHRVTHRLGRQDVLRGDHPLHFTAYISEYALRVPPCSDNIMIEQAKYLAEATRKANIVIRIVPSAREYTPDRQGPFIYFTFDDGSPDSVQMEHYASATTLNNPADVQECRRAIEILDRCALNVESSREMLIELTHDKERAPWKSGKTKSAAHTGSNQVAVDRR